MTERDHNRERKPFFRPDYVSPLTMEERNATLEQLSPTPRIDCDDDESPVLGAWKPPDLQLEPWDDDDDEDEP